MSRTWKILAAGALALLTGIVPRPAAAQAPALTARVDQLIAAGRRDTAIAVVDSVLSDTDPALPEYPEALYWRGMLRTAADSRLDLLRVTVNFPTSPRVSDALYELARREMAGGDDAAAAKHLARIVRDHASSAVGADAALALARMRLAQGALADACPAFDSALAHIPDDRVELRNQTAYAARPCERWREDVQDSLAAARSKAAAPTDTATAESVKKSAARDASRDQSPATARGNAARGGVAAPPANARGSAGASARGGAKPAAPAAARWTVQVAAYATDAEAARLVKRLKDLGYDARVATKDPYRVRVGRFAARDSATAMMTRLKAQRFEAIVVEVERP
jgi:DedD protein